MSKGQLHGWNGQIRGTPTWSRKIPTEGLGDIFMRMFYEHRNENK